VMVLRRVGWVVSLGVRRSAPSKLFYVHTLGRRWLTAIERIETVKNYHARIQPCTGLKVVTCFKRITTGALRTLTTALMLYGRRASVLCSD
jgi:hypothetical protein